MNSPAELPLEVTCQSVHEQLQTCDEFVLIDCRELDEWNHVRIEGARLVPMSELTERVKDLAELREKRLVVYCHHGVRSLRVAHWLRREAGFLSAQSMAGGIDAWSQTIDQTLPRY